MQEALVYQISLATLNKHFSDACSGFHTGLYFRGGNGRTRSTRNFLPSHTHFETTPTLGLKNTIACLAENL